MHKILLKNVNAVLPDRVLDHACVLVQGCRIQEVTDQDLTGRYPEAQIVEGKGRVSPSGSSTSTRITSKL